LKQRDIRNLNLEDLKKGPRGLKSHPTKKKLQAKFTRYRNMRTLETIRDRIQEGTIPNLFPEENQVCVNLIQMEKETNT
jgi:hypothetical protein